MQKPISFWMQYVVTHFRSSLSQRLSCIPECLTLNSFLNHEMFSDRIASFILLNYPKVRVSCWQYKIILKLNRWIYPHWIWSAQHCGIQNVYKLLFYLYIAYSKQCWIISGASVPDVEVEFSAYISTFNLKLTLIMDLPIWKIV